MRKLVDQEVHVHYGQLYVVSEPDGMCDMPDLDEAFAGQVSGLCGAADPGFLWLITGLHTGDVGLTVEIHEHAPDVAPAWEDVVEVPFRPQSPHTFLELWGGGNAWDLELTQTDYRVRYCAQGMDEGKALDTRLKEPLADRYLLQFWPAAPEPDRVVRQTSAVAAYWHGFARELPPPTPASRAEAERLVRAEQKRADQAQRREAERYEWGGRLPTDTLRAAPSAWGLLRFDADLVFALDAAGPGVQREVARFAARSATTAAGLADLDWVAPALTALAQGLTLPPPFDDWGGMWLALDEDPNAPDGTVGEATPPPRAEPSSTELPQVPGQQVRRVASEVKKQLVSASEAAQWKGETPEPSRVSQPHMALPALFHATGPNALEAALRTVSDAVHTFGEDYPAFLREVRDLCASSAKADTPTDPYGAPTSGQDSGDPVDTGTLPAPVVPEAANGILDTDLIDRFTVRIPVHPDMAMGYVVQLEWVVGNSTTFRHEPIEQEGTPMEFTFDAEDAYGTVYAGGDVEISYTVYRDEETPIADSKKLRLRVR